VHLIVQPIPKSYCCAGVIGEIAIGHWTCGGHDMSAAVVPVVAIVNLSAGVLDDQSTARYVNLMHSAVTTSLPDEKRRIATSCIMNEVADGVWGANGTIWRLPQFAAAAGYEHLQHLVGKQ
jgi:hypothetical protein